MAASPDPKTIQLPGDEPERHVRVCDIPDALRELRESAERYRGLYAQQLTEVGRLERLLGEARSTVESQAATIHDLQREVYRLSHDETATEIRRLRERLSAMEMSEHNAKRDCAELIDQVNDLSDKLIRSESEAKLLDRTLEDVGRASGSECWAGCAGGYDLPPRYELSNLFDWRHSKGDRERLAGEICEDTGEWPADCDHPTCWRGWDMGVEIPAELRAYIKREG